MYLINILVTASKSLHMCSTSYMLGMIHGDPPFVLGGLGGARITEIVCFRSFYPRVPRISCSVQM